MSRGADGREGEATLTMQRGPATLRRLLVIFGQNSPKGAVDEADVSTQSSAPAAYAWLSSADEDAGRSCHLETASRQGTAATRGDHTVEVRVGIPTGPFKRVDRLLQRQEFRYVMRHGQAARVGSFVVLAAMRQEKSQGERVRLGLIVSRRVGKAVSRNQVKRRIREWFRHQRSLMKGNLDIVVVARHTAAGISEREMIKTLDEGVRAVGAAA